MKHIFSLMVVMAVFIAMGIGDANAGSRKNASKKNKADCQAWCAKNDNCKKCSTNRACGGGYKGLKTWGGKGRNWTACGNTKHKDNSKKNKDECNKWCEANSHCHFCSAKGACGKGSSRLKKFGGKGSNWHACQRTKSINVRWNEVDDITASQTTLLVAVGGYYGYKTRDGIEYLCQDYFSDHKNIKCISAWGNITTRSKELSRNIKELADKMKKKSGKTPKIILVGKSMGGCKLNSAVYKKNRALKDVNIDLFIGVDMSCEKDCHAKNPKTDSLNFRSNIKQLVNFYQTNDMYAKDKQCGHLVIRPQDNGKPHPDININTNKQGYDINTKKPTGIPVCKDAGHAEIDDCQPLKSIIKKMVLQHAQ